MRFFGWTLRLGLFLTAWWAVVQCQPQANSGEEDRAFGQQFHNLHDSVAYVGKEACRSCHADIYDSFLQTGMGRSFGKADLHRSKADWSGHAVLYDEQLDLHYQAFTRDSALFLREFRIEGGDTVHLREAPISYIVGSGQHTNSHLININGYVYQLPMTYYTQEGRWDLPPGFEGGNNSRFARTIQTECMTCHNAYPQQVPGSEHKYLKIQEGIDCERCHGPGALHVQEKLAGKLVDTAAGPDFSIVNPKRLPVTLQMSICQRCHMQGNAVLKPGKSFFDFKPGMLLEDVVSVFLPRYEGDQSNFTMASHPDRLMQSSCFKKSGEQLSCISCHNPHKSIEITPADHYNQTCGQCHSAKDPCSLPMAERLSASNNCISCHMPKSGTSDIPHVTITDHWIRRPEAANQKKRSSVFVGLSSINEKQPAPLTMAMAWLQYYERFDGKRKSLDSAFHYLAAAESSANRQDWFEAKIHALYLKGDAAAVIRLIRQESASAAASRGWTAYRIGEMQLQSNQLVEAKSYFQKAVEGMPFQLDFQLKLAIAEMQTNQPSEARRRLERVLEEQPEYVPAMSNLGFIYLQMGEDQLAEKWYRKALQLDPDNQAATMNMIGLHLYRGEKGIAKQKLEQLLKKYPRHLQAQQILQSIS